MDGSRLLLVVALVAVPLAGCTGTGGGDSDGDGLSDADEKDPHAITVETAEGTITRNVTSDPGLVDTDGDGLDDFEEFRLGTDPRGVDTDGDGLADGPNLTDPPERAAEALTSAGVIQRDGAWVGEGDLCPGDGLNPADWDSDSPQVGGKGDGLGDGEEMNGWQSKVRDQSNPVTSSPCLRDTEGDGLDDHAERNRSTDPRSADSDGDGVDDRLDADPLWNLHLTFALDEFTLDTDKDTEGGADLRFSVQVESTKDRFWENVTSTGTHSIDRSYDEVDVTDRSATYHQKEVPVFVSVVDDDPTGEDAVRFTSSGSTLDMKVHLFDETAVSATGETLGSAGSGSVSGPDGSLAFSYETVRK